MYRYTYIQNESTSHDLVFIYKLMYTRFVQTKKTLAEKDTQKQEHNEHDAD